MMEKYLGLTEDEILKNERMWEEENQSGTNPDSDSNPGLGNLGIRPDQMDTGMEPDMDDIPDADEGEGDSPISGAEAEPVGDENA